MNESREEERGSGKADGNGGPKVALVLVAVDPRRESAGRNAARLVRDAKLMFEAGSFATATALATLAIEGSGKVSILRELSMAQDEESRRKLWNDHRSRWSKNTGWILPELVVNGV